MMIRQAVVALLTLACVSSLSASFADEQEKHPQRRPLTEADAAAGKPLYRRECSACHGERGDGAGPAADFVDPRPRDLTKGKFKLRTTESGHPPRTSDILRTIERGIAGTAMPSFSFLPEDERKKIAAYVLKLADLLDAPEPEPIRDPGVGPPVTPETIAKGKGIYNDAGCHTCHGTLGKGDGRSAKDLKDEDGRPMKPRNLTEGVFRGGGERADIYYRLATGMAGTPMPAYGDAIDPPELWAVTDYVLSLRAPPMPKPLPADPIAAGRQVAAKYSCQACHVLDDGKGSDVGPDLRVSGQKLDSNWVRGFLKAPHEYGKIYPWRIYRMPRLGLSDDEVGVMTKYIAAIGKRREGPMILPDTSKFPAEKLGEGKLLFVSHCTECHSLGTVVETPPFKQQGPDLIRVAQRVDYQWAKNWILNPKHIDPKTRMTAPSLTRKQVDAVCMFVWKTAVGAGRPASAVQDSSNARAE